MIFKHAFQFLAFLSFSYGVDQTNRYNQYLFNRFVSSSSSILVPVIYIPSVSFSLLLLLFFFFHPTITFSLTLSTDSDMLKFAYAELEESRGSLQAWSLDFPNILYIQVVHSFNSDSLLQSAKKIYESLLSDGVNATALAHIQVSMICQLTLFLPHT